MAKNKLRQGWERLCGEGARHGLLPARRLRGIEETPQPALSKPPRPEPHSSGQPGRRRVNVLPDKPKAKAGSLRERVRRGALKIKIKNRQPKASCRKVSRFVKKDDFG